MAGFPVSTRLVYMGLWGLTDDAGYLELRWKPVPVDAEAPEGEAIVLFDATEIAGELFRHEPRRQRERRVELALRQLVDAGRLELLDCRRHGRIPTIPDHRIKGGELLFTIQKRHEKRCSEELHSPRLHSSPSDSVSVSDSDSSSVSDSVTPRARAQGSNGSEPMSPERAERILADPLASDEAKAGARGYLDLRAAFGRPRKREGLEARP